MVTETLYSTPITNRDASPRVPNSSFNDGAPVIEKIGSVTITTGKTVGSIYVLLSVPANCRLSRLVLNTPALSASTAFDIGAYKTTADGAAVIDADFFASAVACTTANVQLDVTNESGTYTDDKMEQPLWQALGLSAAPASGMIDIALTNTATNAAGGLVSLKAAYCL
jgi:hypothetical protein